MNIIVQFSNKIVNISRNINKTEILKFYINKKNDIDLLNEEEIEKLKQVYSEIHFYNINEKYSENSDGEPELNISEKENDSD